MMKSRCISRSRILMFVLCLGIAFSFAVAADTPAIVGSWEGTLDPGVQAKKRIVVHISIDEEGTLSGTIDYPDQQVSGVQLNIITYKEPALHFESTGIPGSYDGTMSKDNTQINGTLNQGGTPLSLILKKTP
jgi:hypothetical protein